MSRLDELIKKLCPNGVEYRTLGQVVSIERGKRLVRDQLADTGMYPVYQNSMTPLGYHTEYNYPANTVFIIGAGAAGEIGFSQVDFWAADDCFPMVCNEKISSRYLYHALLRIQPQIKSKVRKASIPRLSRNAIEKLKIPVPPLEVQREIVHILDSFTLLTAELTAELTARKKQYDFYRDKLLTFESDIPLLPIKEVVKKSCAGATPAKGNSEYYEGGTIPWIRTQDVRFNEIREVDSFITEKAVEETAAKWIPENCVIVAISGATAGRCAINKIKATTNQHCLNMQIDAEKALYKYVYYCICSKQDELISKKQGARGDLNSSLILGTKIPVPKLEIQKKIVHVLDNFDAICTDLNIGLPAEIEARQKQYEYYRDLLLTFAGTGNMLETDRQTDRQN